MAEKIRFIHAADIHLGSILSTANDNMPRYIQEQLKTVVFDAFDRICQAALQYKVDFLVLSGDVYDADTRSVKANHFFIEKCRQLEKHGIPVFIIAGNHDPFKKEREIQLFQVPDNVKYFDSEAVEIQEVTNRDGDLIARVLGQSYRAKSESRKMYSSYTPPDTGVVNIGLLHTQLDPSGRNYVPCSLSDLLSKNDIDYWALGHIHQCRILNDKDPVIAYSGIPQGRDFGEEQIGGCLLAEFDLNNKPEIYFIPTSSIIWRRIPVDIDIDPLNPPKNFEDLKNLIINEGEKLLSCDIKMPEELEMPPGYAYDGFAGYIVQWVLCGRGEIHEELVQDEEIADTTAAELRNYFKEHSPFIWTDSVIIRTEKELPALAEFKAESSIGREIDEIINSSDFKELVQKELGDIWEVRSDHENVNEIKFQLDDETYNQIIKQAIDLIIEQILPGGEGI